MDPELKNLLYKHPELYTEVYQDANFARPKMFEAMFDRYLGTSPGSILDIGCGTGRDLNFLAQRCSDCLGLDYQSQMVEFARATYPQVQFQQGDMRTVRLTRTFDAIICSGWAINNIHTVADLHATFHTFGMHAHHGSLLILVVLNGAAYLPGGSGRMTTEFVIPAGDYAGKATARFELNRRQQQLIRYRIWDIPGLNPEDQQDFVRFRMLFPMELESYLTAHGFDIVGCFDNTNLIESELLESSLYVASLYRG